MEECEYYKTLLDATLGLAAQHPLYREKWGGGTPDADSLQTLSILHKNELADYTDSSNQSPDNLVYHSSGSTGRLLFRFRSPEDLAFNARFSYALRSQPTSNQEGQGRNRPLVIAESDNYHGGGVPRATQATVLTVPNDLKGIDRAIQILGGGIPGAAAHRRCVRVISGSCDFVSALTFVLLREHGQPSSHGVTAISMYGGYVSSYWRHLLGSIWSTAVSDSYSLSEVFGSAPLCSQCQAYHFTPEVFAEFLDPVTMAPVEAGLAVPVLTELAPFVTHDPLIRYWTGDLVTVSQAPCSCGRPKFRPRGRLSESVIQRDGKVLIAQADLYDLAQCTPEVAWNVGESSVLERLKLPIGRPAIAGALSDRGLTCTVGVRFEPSANPSYAERLRERCEVQIRDILSERLDRDSILRSVSVELVGAEAVR